MSQSVGEGMKERVSQSVGGNEGVSESISGRE